MAEVISNAVEFLKEVFTPLVNNIVLFIIIILIGFIIGRIVGRVIQKVLHELELNNILDKAAGIKIDIEHAIGAFITYFIYFITIVMALNQVGLTTTVLNMLSAGVIVVIILSMLLAIKDFIPNVFAGLFLHRKGFLKKGDNIIVKDVKGKIIYINLVETRVQTKEGDIIYIPNTLLTKSEVRKIKH